MELKLLFCIIFVILNRTNASDIENLEKRIVDLEQYIQTLEANLVKKYGLIQHCETPDVPHGRVTCSSELLKPGESCRVLCNSGYIVTPGHGNATCQSGGQWSLQLECEVPVIILSGGQTSLSNWGGDSSSDSSVEILDLENQKHCKPYIPDMPFWNNTHRIIHNLIYSPETSEILSCGGLSGESRATCDSWKFKPAATEWSFHSYPHKGPGIEMTMDAFAGIKGRVDPDKLTHPHVEKGRYAAESFTMDSTPMILGGMVFDEESHEATKTSRAFPVDWYSLNKPKPKGWRGEKSRYSAIPCKMNIPRAFFCSVKVDDYGVVNIGGFSNKTTTLDVDFRECVHRKFEDINDNQYQQFLISHKNLTDDMPNLPIPLSGHACSALPNSRNILLTGGKRHEKDTSKSHTYLFDWKDGTWKKQWDMVKPRFGHKMITVGDKMYVIGGSSDDNVVDSIEQYDPIQGKWKEIEIKLDKPRVHFGLVLVPRSILAVC